MEYYNFVLTCQYDFALNHFSGSDSLEMVTKKDSRRLSDYNTISKPFAFARDEKNAVRRILSPRVL